MDNAFMQKLLVIGNSFTQNKQNYLWPIPNKQAGDDILYRPQDYIGMADGRTLYAM